jgi:hypothetical protein
MELSAIRQAGGIQHSFFMEHRWGRRIPCRARVRLSAGLGLGGAGRVRNISSSGAFIETPVVLAAGARVTLTVLGNESAARAIEIAAIVVRLEPDGMGVEWCETAARPICAVVGCTVRCAARQDPS